jgi:hypothetical protein
MTANNTAPSFTFELNDVTVHTVISALVVNAGEAKKSRDNQRSAGNDADALSDQRIINRSHKLIGEIAWAAADAVDPVYGLLLLDFANDGWSMHVNEMPTEDEEAPELTA